MIPDFFITPVLAEDMANMDADALLNLQEKLADAAQLIKAMKSNLDIELHNRYALQIAGARHNHPSGKIAVNKESTMSHGKAITVIATNTKKVDWAQEKLWTLFGSLPLDNAKKYIKVTFDINETNYLKLKNELPAWEQEFKLEGLVNVLEEARIVKYGNEKIVLEKVDV